jgi:hypothetical protein
MARSTGALQIDGTTVHPHFYERARRVEDRLIKLIDGGEDLRLWYPPPNLRSVIREKACGHRA